MTNEELLIEARQLLRDLCKMRGEPGAREWVMSIPARPNDPDLVFAQLIERFEAGLGDAVSASPQPLCPKCGSPVCDPYKSTETGMWTQRCNKCEWFNSWAGAAQEQPVENSPQHGICGDCGADRSGPSAEAHDEGCPQKGKP